MRTPEEAIAEILGRVAPLAEHEAVPLRRAFHRVLARDIVSDIDLPPFEKSAMDGYAVRSADLRGPAGALRVALRVVGEARAGEPFRGEVRAGECVGITTGAEVPPSCDSVVMVEKSSREGDRVVLDDRPTPGQHVCRRGEDLARGARVFERGRRLSAVDLAVLAAVGCEPAPVTRRPRVALCTTGDELVTADRVPGPGEIREGNTLTLAARLADYGADVHDLGIVRDDPQAMEAVFGGALERCDALVTTGGVSMGPYDLVGDVLLRLGVEPVLHKVAIKPGKPVWFGVRGRVPVFGLPGNPVSCLLGLEVFVRPALAKLEGADARELEERLLRGRWAGPETRPNPRQQNLPVRAEQGEDGVTRLEPLPWTSSADIVGVSGADGLAVVPAGETVRPGEIVRYRPLERA